MTSNAELFKLIDAAQRAGAAVTFALDSRLYVDEGRAVIQSVTLGGVTMDPFTAAEVLRELKGVR